MNPILVKEMRITSRSPSFLALVFAALLIASVMLLLSLGNASGKPGIGKENLQSLFTVQAACVGLLVPAYAATAFSSERRNRTFDFLRLTSLTSEQLFRGKFLAVIINVLTLLFAFMPLSALCLLRGGTDPGSLVISYCYLLAGLASLIICCLMISAGCDSPAVSTVAGYACTAVFAVLWYCGLLMLWDPEYQIVVALVALVVSACLSSSCYAVACMLLEPKQKASFGRPVKGNTAPSTSLPPASGKDTDSS